jgi:predicted nucleic acid-binding protein
LIYVLDASVAISALRSTERAARTAPSTASRTRLRTGDAIYVWVAEREALPLVTLDAEILARAHLAGVTTVAP